MLRGYTIRGRGGRVKYVGITNNPSRRAAQHRRSGKRGQLRVETGGLSRGKARRWGGDEAGPVPARATEAATRPTTRPEVAAGSLEALRSVT